MQKAVKRHLPWLWLLWQPLLQQPWLVVAGLADGHLFCEEIKYSTSANIDICSFINTCSFFNNVSLNSVKKFQY